MSEQLRLRIKTKTIKKAAEEAFNDMTETFSAFAFCMRVRKILNNHTMDGSILRRLRELRESGRCVYKVIDPVDGIYKKA